MTHPHITIAEVLDRKARGERLTMLTAYDQPMARCLDEAGVDIVLVGDSLGMVVLGYDSTTPVTMDEMIHHAKAARRGVMAALLVGDMPFLSFRGSLDESVKNAADVLELAAAGVQAINIKLMKSGPTEALTMWHVARACHMRLMIGGMVESRLAMGFSAHFAAGLGGFEFVDLDTPLFVESDHFSGGYQQQGDSMDLSHIDAGHGLTLAST